MIRMQNNYLLKSNLDSPYVFASIMGGGLFHKTMNTPLNGVAEIPLANNSNI